MKFKPFPQHVGYDTRVTEYEEGKRGKVPTIEVMDWLAETGINWQFNWTDPEETDPNGVFAMVEYVEIIHKNTAKSGGTFYFDSEEDRLLFCLKWIADGIETPIIWHPV
jgi:hypothetical protein